MMTETTYLDYLLKCLLIIAAFRTDEITHGETSKARSIIGRRNNTYAIYNLYSFVQVKVVNGLESKH